MMDVAKIKEDFPIFKKRKIIYLDNAASTQKPIQVINEIVDFYENHYSNIHRGLHILSQEASEIYEESKKIVANFINAYSWREIIYVRNTTEAINLIANTLPLNKGDKVVTTIMEHHSNFLPWLRLKKLKKIQLEIVDINEEQELDMNDLEKKAKDAKVIAVTFVSNVLGNMNDLKEIRRIADENASILIVDGAQGVPHLLTNVKRMKVDFLAFSAHKMLGPSGIGILYGKEELLEELDVFLVGGGMIKDVRMDEFVPAELPWKFEAGTPFIEGAVGLKAAIEYLTTVGMENIEKHERELIKLLVDGLEEQNIEYYGSRNIKKRSSLVSFNIKGIHAHDVAEYLNYKHIAVRSGLHCAHPLHRRLNIPASVRASVYLYNNEEDIIALLDALKRLIKELNI
ncbi:MAG TPA: cysteine desulfurase [Candidatus Nanopusillus sp.]|nr:cysteine desulfurase [Candidatus Nanopusillus sp.]